MKVVQRVLLSLLFVGGMVSVAKSGDYYTHGSFPSPSSPATSASMRAELDLIAAGFDKLPTLSGNANKPVLINGSATGLTVAGGTLSLGGNFAISGAFATTLTVTGTTTLTLPTTGTLATLAGAESLSNKTISSPVLSGTATGTYTLAGAPTISSPTISSPVLSGTATGTYTMAGTGTYTSPIINAGTVGADPTTALGIADKQYVDARFTTPTNLLTNTQWKIRTANLTITKFNAAGTGTLPTIAVSSYTTGTNTPVFTTTNTTELKVGDVVKFSGADTNVNLSGIEVTAVTANTSFTGALAQGKQSTASGACTAQLISRGDITNSTGAGPDPWQKTQALNLWIDDNAVNSKAGSPLQVGLQQTAGTAQYFQYLFLPQGTAGGNYSVANLAPLLGRTLVFGAWVNYKVRSGSGSYRVFIQTNTGYTYSAAVTATGYTWSEVTLAIPTNATLVTVGIELNGSVNDAFYVSQPMLAYGSLLGSGNYTPEPHGVMFTPVVKFTPFAWTNATLTFPAGVTDGVYPWTFYLKAETLEAVDNTVLAAFTESEGLNNNGAGRALALMGSTTAPQLDGPIIYSQVTSVKNVGMSWWWFRSGTGRVYAINSADSWSNVSIDFSGYILN